MNMSCAKVYTDFRCTLNSVCRGPARVSQHGEKLLKSSGVKVKHHWVTGSRHLAELMPVGRGT